VLDTLCEFYIFFILFFPFGLLIGSGFMSPGFYVYFFSLFSIIYMSNWKQIRLGFQLSWTLLLLMSFFS